MDKKGINDMTRKNINWLITAGISLFAIIAAAGCSVLAPSEREAQTLQLEGGLFRLSSELEGLGNIDVPDNRLAYSQERFGNPMVVALAYGAISLRDSLPPDRQPYRSVSQITAAVRAKMLSDMQRSPESITIVSVPVPSAALDLEITEVMEQVGLWQIAVFGLSRQPSSVADLRPEDIVWAGLDVDYVNRAYQNGTRVLEASIWLEPLCASDNSIDACLDSDGDGIPDTVDSRIVAFPENRALTITKTIPVNKAVISDIQFVEGLDSQAIAFGEGEAPELTVEATDALGQPIAIENENNPFALERIDNETFQVIVSAPDNLGLFYTYRVAISAALSGGSAASNQETIEYQLFARASFMESSNGLAISIDENDDGTVELTDISFALGRLPAEDSPYQILGGNSDGIFSIDDNGALTVSNWDYDISPPADRLRSVIVQGTDSGGNVGTLAIDITLANLDDEAPVFGAIPTGVTVEARTTALSEPVDIDATDDLGPEITYAFVNDSGVAVAPNGSGLSIFGDFAIHSGTGVITVETAPKYSGDATDTRTLTIRATDTSPGAIGDLASDDAVIAVQVIPVFDSDNDGLIDINTLEELNNIRYNLEGTSYKVSADGSGNSDGCPATGCFGYELMGDLDFADPASYADGLVNNDWLPIGGDPDTATNAGWEPIGSCNTDSDGDGNPCGDANDTPFAAMFEGNGYTIANLYTRGAGGVGLFGITAESAEIRNVGVVGNNSYGGSGGNHAVGGLIGFNGGDVIASYATGDADGSDGALDLVGGLVGSNNGEIIASYATGDADGGGGDIDAVGGLVGSNNGEIIASYTTGGGMSGTNVGGLVGASSGEIIASYATGNANGIVSGGLVGWNDGEIIASYATGNTDGEFIGGLVGLNYGEIIASYATGNADGGAGGDFVGGLVGRNAGEIIASYATGDADSGGAFSETGALVGENGAGAITASYGFGDVAGAATVSVDRADDADESIHSPVVLTAINSSTTPANRWNTTVWDFGNDRLYPVVKWVTGYDATAGTFSCDQTMLPDGQTCGDPIPDQHDSDDDGTQDMVPAAPATPTAAPTVSTITITWTAPAGSGITAYRLYRNATEGDNALGNRPIATVAASEPLTYTDSAPLDGENYYAVSAISEGGEGARSPSASATRPSIDSDGDGLIDIDNLEALNNIRYNLKGTSYKVSADGSGNSEGCPATGCFGYELMGNLDFADAASYAAGSVNSDWRPDNADPDMATNAGWEPISDLSDRFDQFSATFAGNGNTIANLYSRGGGVRGLFGEIGADATIRNVGIIDGAIYGDAGDDDIVGGLAGFNSGEIIASYATGTANGGAGGDIVGGLVGFNSGEIIASYAIGDPDGGAGDSDNVGGLAGRNSGEIIASYADGYADGGAGDGDNVGGLIGVNNGSGRIIASYAAGDADGGIGNDHVGGLIGINNSGGEITASYAAGDADGGIGNDHVAGLVGFNSGKIIASYAAGSADGGAGDDDKVGRLVAFNGSEIASYGFGAVIGQEVTNASGAPPGGVTSPVDLTAANAGARWNAADDDTLNAWDFGSGSQTPALRFADYDGAGTDYDCDMFPATLPGGATITCGTTLIPGQGR